MHSDHKHVPKPINPDEIDLEKMREKTTETPGLLPYAHTSGSAVIRPEDMNSSLARSMGAMEKQTDMQMQQIMAQMQLLADQANAIQTRKTISERVYKADIRFEPVIGHTYYLYQREGKDMLSLVAPNEWGRSKKSQIRYVARIQLLADHTWDVLHLNPEDEVVAV